MNIKSDGIFTIQKGQGLSQGIANEIGLSEEQLKMFNEIEYFPYLVIFLIGILFTVLLFSKLIMILLKKFKILLIIL